MQKKCESRKWQKGSCGENRRHWDSLVETAGADGGKDRTGVGGWSQLKREKTRQVCMHRCGRLLSFSAVCLSLESDLNADERGEKSAHSERRWKTVQKTKKGRRQRQRDIKRGLKKNPRSHCTIFVLFLFY